jgi:hypothetical protein
MKPCPFCGETDDFEPVEVALDFDCETWNWHTRCSFCGALGPECGTKAIANDAWDERDR